LACACPPPTEGEATPTPPPDEAELLFIATVAGDYASGVLATFDPESGELRDNLFTLGGEAFLHRLGERLAVVEGFGLNRLSVFDRGDLSTPVMQVSTGDGTNPRAVVACGDSWWVSLYDGAGLLRVDPSTGDTIGPVVDLSGLDPSEDGRPEPASMVVLGGRLLVALELLDRYDGWVSVGHGAIAEIDCSTGAVVDSWSVGPSPHIVADPTSTDGLLLKEGLWYDDDFAPLLDGGLRRVDGISGDSGPLIFDETELEGNLDGFGFSSSGSGLLQVAPEPSFDHHCVRLDNEEGRLLETTDAWWTRVVEGPKGLFWVAQRPSWSAPAAPSGVRRIDAEACAEAGMTIETTLPPSDLLWL
jgi:hypothetical protein